MRRYLLHIGFFCIWLTPVFPQYLSVDELLNKGSVEISQRRFADAINSFSRVINMAPSNLQAYTGRAMACIYSAFYEEAMRDIVKALSIDNNYPEAYYVRGWLEIYQRQYDRALLDFNTALDINPSFKPAKAGRIQIYILMNDIVKAQELADACIKEDPSYGDYFFYKAKIMNMRQKYQDAIEYFNLALDISTNIDRYEIYLNRGNVKQTMNLLISAKDDFDKAIGIDSSHASAFHARAVTFYRLGYYPEALKDFNKAIELIEQSKEKYENPNEAYYNRGMTYFRLSEYGKACRNFHTACGLGNTNACKMVVLNCSAGNP